MFRPSSLFVAVGRFASRARRGAAVLSCVLSLAGLLPTAHGNETITFQPAPLPRGDRLIDEWVEQDLRFSTPNGMGSNDVSDDSYPYNGTTYLSFLYGDTPLTINTVDGQPFSVFSVDLAEYSTVFTRPAVITFVGTHVDGTTDAVTFRTDGIIDGNGPGADFQTFTFPASFKDLQKVTVDTDIYSLDNFVVNVVPARPVISSSSVAFITLGRSFDYLITATNSPTSFTASPLPDGLTFNPATGVISGTPTLVGNFNIALAAANESGAGTAMLALTVLPAPPVVTLSATTPEVTVGSGAKGVFTLTLPEALTKDLYVRYTIKGTALNGTDYTLLKQVKKIKAGQTSKAVKIVPRGDLDGASKKTVKLVLTPDPANYAVGTPGKVTVKILSAP